MNISSIFSSKRVLKKNNTNDIIKPIKLIKIERICKNVTRIYKVKIYYEKNK
jgi:hypothetical protein